ncbi:MAG: hypothetical protein EB127_24725 [Alphaproteobacteria bacterium]|nr:hypothetical protein [Alphaproteobacteria bacterium]
MELPITRIIKRETALIQAYYDSNFSIKHDQENLRKWAVEITTDEDSLYGIRKFALEIVLPPMYPWIPPVIQFITPIDSICVDNRGYLLLDTMLHQWSPALGLATIVISILSLLNEREPDYYERKRQSKRTELIYEELMCRIWSPIIEDQHTLEPLFPKAPLIVP